MKPRPAIGPSKACTAACPCLTTRLASGNSGGRSLGRRFWLASDTWTRATGALIWQAVRNTNMDCYGWSDDLAEVLGSAVALNLMFHIPLLWAVIITGLDVLLLLALQRFGMRTIEAVVVLLIATIGVCYWLELFVLPQTHPNFMEMGLALVSPNFRRVGMIYVAIGIIGATVMPHNLYLHSALVQSRQLQKDERSIRSAIRFNTIDSVTALAVAFFVNAAILVLAAMVFYGKTSVTAAGGHAITFSPNSDWTQTLVAPADYAHAGDYSGGAGYWHSWRRQCE